MRGSLTHITRVSKTVVLVRRSLWCLALALMAVSGQGAAQEDSTSAGPPPHFAAAWAAAGTLIDVSRMGTLRHRLSLDLTDVPIDTAIRAIRERAGLELLYRPDLLPAGRRVSVRATDITAASALAEVLLDTDVDVVMIRGGHLVLAKCTHLMAGAEGRDSGVVAGRVIDRTTGAPIAGATVTIDGIRLATATNPEGRYRLVGLPVGTHVAAVRYIGYASARAAILVGPGAAVQDFALAPSVQQLEQVVVTGTLVPTEVKALPTPITIITADEIREQRVMRMDQLFRGQVAGVLAQDLGGDDYFNLLNIRGASSLDSRPVKTFIDGIEIADPAFITALIDPNSIDRIELTRGPQASAIYGAEAIGGVLQIFTKKGQFDLSRPAGEIKASASVIEKNDGPGAAARFDNSATLRGGEQHTRYHVAGYYRRDGEWTPSYQNTNWSVTASAENVQGPLTSRITGLLARKTFGRPWRTALRNAGYVRYSKPPYETIEVQTQTYGANFTYTAAPWWRHDLVLGYDQATFDFHQTQRRFTTPNDTLLQAIMNRRSKMSILYHTTVNGKLYHSTRATLTIGFNHYRLAGSNVFSSATSNVEGTLDGPATILRLPSTNMGYFAQARIDATDAISVTAGVRVERNPDFGEDIGTAVSPRLGIAYARPVGYAAIKLRLAYGESIRAPDPAHSRPGSNAQFDRLANPMLRPERQQGVDGGVDVHWGSQASFSATYYHQDAVDLISQVLIGTIGDPPRVQTRQDNVGRIRNRGLEVETRYSFSKLQVSGTFSTASSIIRRLAAEYNGNYQVGDRVLGIPHRSVGMTMRYSPFVGTAFSGSFTHVGSWIEQDAVALYGALFGGVPPRASTRDYWTTYPAFTRFRLGVEHKIWKGISGALDVENVTNNRASEPNNFSIPSPRTLILTLWASYS
jgi:outer membrane cobalamin receptor